MYRVYDPEGVTRPIEVDERETGCQSSQKALCAFHAEGRGTIKSFSDWKNNMQ